MLVIVGLCGMATLQAPLSPIENQKIWSHISGALENTSNTISRGPVDLLQVKKEK
jgi:hypothetical protein